MKEWWNKASKKQKIVVAAVAGFVVLVILNWLSTL